MQLNHSNSQSNFQSNEPRIIKYETYTPAQARKPIPEPLTEKENNRSTVHKILHKNVKIYSRYTLNLKLSLITKKGNAYELLPLARKTIALLHQKNYVDKLKPSSPLDRVANLTLGRTRISSLSLIHI